MKSKFAGLSDEAFTELVGRYEQGMQGIVLQDMVPRYIELRDERLEFNKWAAGQAARYERILVVLEDRMRQCLAEAGAESIRTSSGTVFKKTITRYAMQDWSAFFEYLLRQALENARAEASEYANFETFFFTLLARPEWDWMEHRLSRAKAGDIPELPGVELSSFVDVQVRRA